MESGREMGVRVAAALSVRLIKDGGDTRQVRGRASHVYGGLRQRSGFRADTRRAFDQSGQNISGHDAELLCQ